MNHSWLFLSRLLLILKCKLKTKILILCFLPIQLISIIIPVNTDLNRTNHLGISYHRDGNTISLSLDVPRVQWDSTSVGKSLSFPNTQMLSTPGYPDLPYYSVFLAIPPDVTIQPTENLSPAKFISAPIDLAKSPQPDIDQIPNCVQSLPQSAFEIGEPFWFRNQRLVSISIYPVRWDCAASSFLWNQSLELSFTFDNLPETKTFPEIDYSSKTYPLQHQIINFQDSLSWFSDPPVLWGGDLQQPWTTRACIGIQESGIYRIAFEELQLIGFPLENVDPDFFHIENQGREVAFLIEGDGDNRFELGESLLFYAETFSGEYLANLYQRQNDQWPIYNDWQPEFSAFMLEKYTETNVYWLYISDEPGLQIISQDGTPNAGTNITSFYDQIHFEEEKVWWTTHFTNEDTWFWEYLDVNSFPKSYDYSFRLYDPVISSDFQASISGQILSVTSSAAINPDHRVQFALNQQMLSEDTWDGATRHHFKGNMDQQYLVNDENTLSLSIQSQGLPVTRYVFDDFIISYQRQLKVINNKLIFNSSQMGELNLEISNLSSAQNYLWNISNPFQPTAIQNSVFNAGLLIFGKTLAEIQKFIVVNHSAIQSVTDSLTLYQPVDLLSAQNKADYLIISPKEFLIDLQPLVQYRESQGLKVKLIDLQDVYNQFNYGITHPIAVKNFFGYAYQHWQSPAPSYVLLVGDGHWDLKNNRIPEKVYFPPNFVWVDPLQGEVDSLSDLVAVAGDDIFPDAMIGRMPVNNSVELAAFIEKTIQFEGTSADWLSNLTFVADNYFLQDPNTFPACIDDNPATICPTDPAGNFPAYVNQLLSDVDLRPYQINKIFLDDLGCRSSTPDNCSVVRNEILKAFNDGSQVITYNGHGAISYWAGEKVLQVDNLPDLTNLDRYPVVFSLDCVDGYWYYPPDLPGQSVDRRSLSEELTRAAEKGAAAMFSSPGNGYANGHDLLQRGFFSALMNLPEPALGALDLNARLNLMSNHGNDSLIFTYMIFGDPALKMHSIDWGIFLPLVTR